MSLINANDPLYKKVELQVKEILRLFQQGYTDRNPSNVQDYMSSLFAEGSGTIMTGTCDNEWCLGFDEALEMVKSDWQYWGDLQIDVENSDISTDGSTAWFIAYGSVKYSFEDSEEKYKRWLDSIMNHFDSSSDFAALPDKAKLSQINWMLSLFISSRPDEKRSYKWPLRLTGVLTSKNGRWLFRSIQFALPNKADYCDVRFNDIKDFEKEYSASCEKLQDFKKQNPVYRNVEVEDIINAFQTEYTIKSAEDLIQKFFLKDESICFTDLTDGNFTGALEIGQIIKKHKSEWECLYLDSSSMLSAISGNTAWFTVQGFIKKTIKENAAVSKQIENIKQLVNENNSLSSKDKLFKIRKDISLMFRETSKGDEYILPIRFEGVLIKENNLFKFHTARFSYPYYWVIEGHYDQ